MPLMSKTPIISPELLKVSTTSQYHQAGHQAFNIWAFRGQLRSKLSQVANVFYICLGVCKKKKMV
jgi:hypothetical protein